MEEIFLGLFAIAWAIGTPIIAIVALVRTSRLREMNERLTAEVALLRRQGVAAEVLPPPFVAEPAAEPVAQPVIEQPPAVEPARWPRVAAAQAPAQALPSPPLAPPVQRPAAAR